MAAPQMPMKCMRYHVCPGCPIINYLRGPHPAPDTLGIFCTLRGPTPLAGPQALPSRYLEQNVTGAVTDDRFLDHEARLAPRRPGTDAERSVEDDPSCARNRQHGAGNPEQVRHCALGRRFADG